MTSNRLPPDKRLTLTGARLIVPLVGAVCMGARATGPVPLDVPFVVTRLGLDLRVDYERGTVNGTATLRLRNVSDRSARTVPLLLNRLMTVSRTASAAGADMAFEQRVVVFQDDSIRQVNAIVITPERPIPPGDSLAVVLSYGGVLVGYTETGSLHIKDHVSRGFTILREDAYAFPTLGLPSWKSSRAAPREPFAFEARITVPAGLVVATGGDRGESTERDSVVTWSYHSSEPVPFLNITIAPYRLLGNAVARIFYFPADSSGARTVERAVAGAVERYTRWYGPLRREPQLVVMEIPEGWGSQASLTAGIIETADAFRDRAQLHQVYHDLSHLWNVPDLDRPSPRWNEGLASFLEWRMAAELDGWDGWDARLDRLQQALRSGCEPRRPCATVPFADYGKSGVTGLSYQVGALMFYSLYKALGRDTFDRTYREFFQGHGTRGATSAELVAAFRRADPLSERIFADWFFTTQWHTRLAEGQSVRQILDGYTQR